MKAFAWIAGIIGFVAVAAYLSFAAYEGSWTLSQSIATHQTNLQRHGFEYQSTLSQQIDKDIALVQRDTVNIKQVGTTEAQNEGLFAARASDATDVCNEAQQITENDVDQGALTWVHQNCSFGSLSPSSIYYVSGAGSAQ